VFQVLSDSGALWTWGEGLDDWGFPATSTPVMYNLKDALDGDAASDIAGINPNHNPNHNPNPNPNPNHNPNHNPNPNPNPNTETAVSFVSRWGNSCDTRPYE